jgi:hypothetical protein
LFEQTFKNIDHILHKDAGCSSELDYVEQTSWILFQKYLADLEQDRRDAAELSGKSYTPIIDPKYSWDVWASPKNGDGKLDQKKLPDLLKLKYHALDDARQILGSVQVIRNISFEFQKYLYAQQVTA